MLRPLLYLMIALGVATTGCLKQKHVYRKTLYCECELTSDYLSDQSDKPQLSPELIKNKYKYINEYKELYQRQFASLGARGGYIHAFAGMLKKSQNHGYEFSIQEVMALLGVPDELKQYKVERQHVVLLHYGYATGTSFSHLQFEFINKLI